MLSKRTQPIKNDKQPSYTKIIKKAYTDKKLSFAEKQRAKEIRIREKLENRFILSLDDGDFTTAKSIKERIEALPSEQAYENTEQAETIKSIKEDKISDLNQRDLSGKTLLATAIKKKDFSAVDFLLNENVDPDGTYTERKTKGKTPLNLAISLGQHEIVEKLLAHDADPDKRELHTGKFPLNVAASLGYTFIVDKLIKNHANINLADTKTGLTPLMTASKAGHVGVATLLLESKADMNTFDRQGKTALDHAREEEQLSIIALLLRYTATISNLEAQKKIADSASGVINKSSIVFFHPKTSNTYSREYRKKGVEAAKIETVSAAKK